MTLDYKERIQCIFENYCVERYGTDEYWRLPQDLQYKLYQEATELYSEMLAERADYMRKAERERM